jgi:hypothetical protein
MPLVAFHKLCLDVASRETRTLRVLPAAQLGVPAGDYPFIEMFCDEPACGCRRVFLTVHSSTPEQVQAVIAWGWEERAFDTRWLGINDPRRAREMQGPILNLAPFSVGACRGLTRASPENALGGSRVCGQDQATLRAVSLENPRPRQ